MDRHRFSNRARELRAFADRIVPLAKMPDRATETDLQRAVDLALKAASDLDELVNATPTGCVCRRIQRDDYDYLDYAENCIHHRQLYVLSEKLKTVLERLLHLVESALDIADETIRRITETS